MSGTKGMSTLRLKNAQDRLCAAIERLEAALDQGGDLDQGVVQAGNVEISALQSENAALKEILGQALSRLDTVIRQFKTRHNA